LGPLLFIIFINDIISKIKNSNILLYADDLKIFRRVDNVDDCLKLQEDVNALINWSNFNLKFNVKKCAVMTYSKKIYTNIIRFNYSMNGESLSRKTSIKDLGIIFDPKLSFVEHIISICKSAYSILGFIKRSGSFLQSPHSLKLLFDALVRSRLEYGSLIWYPHATYLLNTIEQVQAKFLRFLFYKALAECPSSVRENF